MAKSVLVAGGAGYIGSHTVKALYEKGYDIVVLDSLCTGHRAAVSFGQFYKGDIDDCALVEDIVRTHAVEAVIDFAGLSLVGESVEQPDRYWEENVSKTNRFLSVLVRNGVKRFVFSSSASVYGESMEQPVPEKAALLPVSPYGAAKRAVEQMLPWMEQAYGLKWISLRYFNAAGAAMDGMMGEDHHTETHLIPLVIQTVLGQRDAIHIFGNDYPTPDGTCIRDYVHVDDLADVHIAALEALDRGDTKSQAINVGSGAGYSVREIIDKVKEVSGEPINEVIASRRKGDPPILVANVERIRRELGWQPRFSDLDTIISSAWRWHSSHPNGYNDTNI